MAQDTDTAKQSPTEMLRNYAAANGIIKKREVKKALDFTPRQIDSSFGNLAKSGELERVSHGVYKFVPIVEKPVFDVTEKIWRAMKAKRKFSASDIAMLAETTIAYVYKLFRRCRADGYIKQAGVRSTYGSGKEKLWRLTLKGRNKAVKPNVAEFTPDPLVMDTVNLNRLVCSGLAAREEASADDAITLCKRIINRLENERMTV